MIQRLAFLLVLSLGSVQSASLEVEPAFLRGDNYHRDLSYQHRELSFGSWWSTVLYHIDHAVHPPCPIHEQNGQCNKDHRPFGPIGPHCRCESHHHSSSHSSSSSSSTSTSKTSFVCVDSDGNDVSCSICTDDNTGDENVPCYPNVPCTDDEGASDDKYPCIPTDDNVAEVVGDDAWNNDGYTDNNVPATDDAAEVVVDDAWTADGWAADGWEESNLSGASLARGNISTPIWPFVLGALVAGVVGAAFVVTRRKRRVDMENHPLDGSVKKRMGAFGMFSGRRSRSATVDEEGKPSFIEINEMNQNGSYKSPQTGMKNSPTLMDDASQGSY